MKKRTWIILTWLALGVGLFICALKWDINELVLPSALATSVSLLLVPRLVTCSACGREAIAIGKAGASDCCRLCKTPYARPDGTIFSALRGRKRLALELPIAVIYLLLGSIRLLCLPVMALHILLAVFAPAQRRDRWMNFTAVAFLVLMFLPVDIEVGGFHGSRWGVSGKGPRFVRLVMGMPAIGPCVENYGEFISGGCCVHDNDPQWLFVWEEAGLRASKIYLVNVKSVENSKRHEEN